MRLNELASKYNTDKKIPNGVKCKNGLLGHGYTTQYESIISKREINCLLEIGVSFGDSIRMWDEYFGGNCDITGIDIEEKRFKKINLETKNIRIKIGDQSDVKFLKTLADKNYDLIIDDGSHIDEHQLVSFKHLFNCLKPKGIYIIEDLHVQKGIKTKELFKHFEFEGKLNNPYFLDFNTEEIEKVDFLEKVKLCVIYKK